MYRQFGIATLIVRGLAKFYSYRFGMNIGQRFAWLIHQVKVLQYQSQFRLCGENLRIQFPLMIAQPEKVEIGNDVSFASFVHIWGEGGVAIGDRVMIGSHAAITSVTHDYQQKDMFLTVVTSPIWIQDDVWIGTHAVILPGITIGEGAVIGAGSIVTKDVPPFSVVAGAPARVIKKRRVSLSLASQVGDGM